MFEILRPAALRDDEPEVWAGIRRPPRESDRALNGTARNWVRSLPHRRRPLRLCIDFPRVANRLAWVWPDTALTAQTLEDLLVDRRGGRRGFPAPVQRELRRLQEFNAAQRAEPVRGALWGLRPPAPRPATP
jgi:hypothetical protein